MMETAINIWEAALSDVPTIVALYDLLYHDAIAFYRGLGFSPHQLTLQYTLV